MDTDVEAAEMRELADFKTKHRLAHSPGRDPMKRLEALLELEAITAPTSGRKAKRGRSPAAPSTGKRTKELKQLQALPSTEMINPHQDKHHFHRNYGMHPGAFSALLERLKPHLKATTATAHNAHSPGLVLKTALHRLRIGENFGCTELRCIVCRQGVWETAGIALFGLLVLAGDATATETTHGVSAKGTVPRHTRSIYDACTETIARDCKPTKAAYIDAAHGFAALAGSPEPLGICGVIDGHKRLSQAPTDPEIRAGFFAYGSKAAVRFATAFPEPHMSASSTMPGFIVRMECCRAVERDAYLKRHVRLAGHLHPARRRSRLHLLRLERHRPVHGDGLSPHTGRDVSDR